jgi:molecular chaperone HtpG
MMVHSVYSDRSIFLRELISNAADACEKLRFEGISNAALLPGEASFAIRIEPDTENSTLTIADNGIGMSRDDLIKALGTIAHSGTRDFLDRHGSRPEAGENEETPKDAIDSSLIGQFGVGFYSAFIVADHVDVISRRAGSDEVWKWSSNGGGSYRIEKADTDIRQSGTRVLLHIKSDAKEFLDSYRLESIIREHSAAIQIPIDIVGKTDDETRRVADGAALWSKPKSAISSEEYTEFYRDLARQFDEPALTVHWKAEGRNEYTVLAFIPGSRPLDLFDPARKGRAKLYVKRVLITEDADLLPAWLRFVRIVVDAADVPLNVSRELVQKSPIVAAIKKAVTNRILQELGNLAKNDADRFAEVWKNFGAVIKEGLYEDAERRDQIFEIARFATTNAATQTRSLRDYVADLKPNQTAIYYIAGDDAGRLTASPQLEGFRARGIEVLVLSDPVDAFWTTTALGFDGKPFKSITQSATDLKDIGEQKDSVEDKPEHGAKVATLMAFAKQTLKDVAEDVRTSDKLSESPACLVASDKAMDRRLERILAEHGRLQEKSKPVLELNAEHELILKLSQRLQEKGEQSFIEDSIWMLFDEARMIEGEQPTDPVAFRQRLFRMMSHSLA